MNKFKRNQKFYRNKIKTDKNINNSTNKIAKQKIYNFCAILKAFIFLKII